MRFEKEIASFALYELHFKAVPIMTSSRPIEG